jgi:hypothetical protein
MPYLQQLTDIGARVYNSGNITVATGGWHTLTFDSERYDTDTIHSTVVNTERLTATTPGTYIIVGNVEWASDATGDRGMRIYLNNTTVIGNLWQNPADSAPTRHCLTTIYQLSATEYVELEVYQSTAGNLNIVAQSNFSPVFMMQRIAP